MAIIRWVLLGLLFALRIPSLSQPAAADQSLYAYVGVQILNGGAPYLDAWDQKPPAIHLIYALLWWIWPDERVVAAADLTAAAVVCWLLVVLGRRLGSTSAGWVAAGVFMLLGNPSMHRLSGVFIRAQCETFIALAVTGALVLSLSPERRRSTLAVAGVLLGVAIWLKYPAVTFGVPVFVAVWLLPRRRSLSETVGDWLTITGGAAALGALGLIWRGWHGALGDFWLATYTYNVAYSSAGYTGPGDFAAYLTSLPFRQAQRELLWLLGLVGILLAGSMERMRAGAIVAASWVATAVAAIALNGLDLPQYFVQATPALALGAGLGAQAAWQSPYRSVKLAAVLVLVGGLWRVGVDRPAFGNVRLAGLPGLIENVRFDLAYWTGAIDRRTYFERFGGSRAQDKYDALAVDDLARYVAATTRPDDSIYVFGFSPGVYVKAHRASASRFFWNSPVTAEFAAHRPGYGMQGLADDLARARPALVALQKGDWDPDSVEVFMSHSVLSAWLLREYIQEDDGPRFVVWRRRGG